MSSDCREKVQLLFARYNDDKILSFMQWIVMEAKQNVVDQELADSFSDISAELSFIRSNLID